MSWLDAVPSLVVAAAWLLAPGVLTSYALGLRGLAAWTVAPAISTALIAVSAIVAGKAGWAWSPLVAAALSATPALVIVVVRTIRRHPFTAAVSPDPLRVRLAGWLGLIPAGVIGSLIIIQGFRSPGNLSQTYDGTFHYNALRWILVSGEASSLSLGGLGADVPSFFYPGAWHAFASLIPMSSNAAVVVAGNVATAVIAVVAWPLACLFLSRQIFGQSIPALALTGLVSVSFTAFPGALIGYLWPNVLGFALMPIGVGAGLSILGLATKDTLSHGRAWVILWLTVIATGLAQPNATFGLAAILLFPALFALAGWMYRQYVAGKASRGALGGLAAVAAATATWLAVHSVDKVMAVKSFDGWKPIRSISGAVGEVLLNATNSREPLWLLSIAVIAGVILAFRSWTTAWLPFAHGFLAALYVMSAAVQTPTTHIFTGFWYSDSQRLAALIPVTGVVLAVGGIKWGAEQTREAIARLQLANRVKIRIPSVKAVSGVFGVLLLLATAYSTQAMAVAYLHKRYNAAGETKGTLVGPHEREFYRKVDKIVPDDAVVAGNPWNGSALLWTLTGTPVLFPQLGNSAWSPEQEYLAKHLNEAASNPKVCRLLERYNVEYLLLGTKRFWRRHSGTENYPGLTHPQAHPGFELVAKQGKLELYRVTACDNALASAEPSSSATRRSAQGSPH